MDLLGRALPVEPDADPVQAVRDWLATSNDATPRLLRLKAVVGLYPANTAARSRYRSKAGEKPRLSLGADDGRLLAFGDRSGEPLLVTNALQPLQRVVEACAESRGRA